MNATQQPQSAPGEPNGTQDGQSSPEVDTALTAPHTAVGRQWLEAHAYAVVSGIDEPEAFADDYASMIDEARHETRYPDRPLPTPAEFVWP